MLPCKGYHFLHKGIRKQQCHTSQSTLITTQMAKHINQYKKHITSISLFNDPKLPAGSEGIASAMTEMLNSFQWAQHVHLFLIKLKIEYSTN